MKKIISFIATSIGLLFSCNNHRTTQREDEALSKIKTTFNFLLTDFGFRFIEEEKRTNLKAKYFLIYRNDISKLQVEICADKSWFHCEIRRLINGQPAKYSDKENCFGFENLAILESNNHYEHMDYFVGGSGLTKVLVATSKLFQRNKAFFTTDCWIDLKRVEQLRDEESQAKSGFKPSENKNKPTYFKELKKEAMKFLSDNGYELVLDSEELSPFDERKMVKNFVMQKEGKKIRIAQHDWRDDYYIYDIEVDGKKVFEMNIREHPEIEEAVKLTMEKLRACV